MSGKITTTKKSKIKGKYQTTKDMIKDVKAGLREEKALPEEKKDIIHYSDWSVLLGFESEQNALRFIQLQGLKNFSNEDWLPKIRHANSAVNKISNRTKVNPEIKELDKKYDDHINKLQNESTFPEHLTGITSHRFALVEISKIHCFQKMLNLEFIASLEKKAPELNDMDNLVHFCLPTLDEKPSMEILRTSNADNTVSFISENLDFRKLGIVEGQDNASKRQFFGFQYGFGLPLISVAKYKGIYFLKNGYHRTFALFKKGHQYVPCVLITTDNFQNTGAQSPGFFPIDLIMSDKSPILSDFVSNAAIIISRRRLKKMISIHAEIQTLPV